MLGRHAMSPAMRAMAALELEAGGGHPHLGWSFPREQMAREACLRVAGPWYASSFRSALRRWLYAWVRQWAHWEEERERGMPQFLLGIDGLCDKGVQLALGEGEGGRRGGWHEDEGPEGPASQGQVRDTLQLMLEFLGYDTDEKRGRERGLQGEEARSGDASTGEPGVGESGAGLAPRRYVPPEWIDAAVDKVKCYSALQSMRGGLARHPAVLHSAWRDMAREWTGAQDRGQVDEAHTSGDGGPSRDSGPPPASKTQLLLPPSSTTRMTGSRFQRVGASEDRGGGAVANRAGDPGWREAGTVSVSSFCSPLAGGSGVQAGTIEYGGRGRGRGCEHTQEARVRAGHKCVGERGRLAVPVLYTLPEPPLASSPAPVCASGNALEEGHSEPETATQRRKLQVGRAGTGGVEQEQEQQLQQPVLQAQRQSGGPG